jgi:glycosyltransferase involved in cell wall biosynthesis
MARILHLLPHPGQGGQRYVEELKAGLSEHEHDVAAIAGSPSPLRAAPGMLLRRPPIASHAVRADLVHVHGDMTAMLSRRLAAGRPVVFTTHGLHFVRRKSGRVGELARARLSRVVNEASVTLCTSEAEHSELCEIAGPDARLVLARNGVRIPPRVTPEHRVAARAALGLTDAAVAVLFVGELSERKGPLLAARAATASEHGLVLLVAGDGPQRRELRGLESPAVRPLGYRDDVPELLAAADLFVLPSSREGLSLALLEAMAHGVMPIVADGPGNPEAVGEAGIVVAAGDEGAFQAALDRAAADPKTRRRLGAAARERVEAEFSLDRMLELARGAYAEALGTRATA